MICLVCSLRSSRDSRLASFSTALNASLAWLVGWLVGMLVGWSVDRLAWFAWLAWFARPLQEGNFEIILKFCRRKNFKRDFPGKNLGWAWFFRRPLYQCDFKIWSTTPQLDPNRKPIWFCNCKLRYTVWEIWESQLNHIRFLADLKHLKVIPSFLPSSRSICEGRGVVVFCLGVVS